MTARDAAEIQRDIEATRAELAAAVEAIAERVSPRRVVVRGVNRVRAALGPGSGRRLRTDRVAIVAVAVGGLAVAGWLTWRRRS